MFRGVASCLSAQPLGLNLDLSTPEAGGAFLGKGRSGGDGRSGEIRTPDPLLPKQVRYQAALHSVWLKASYIDKRGWPRNKAFAAPPRGGGGLRMRCSEPPMLIGGHPLII